MAATKVKSEDQTPSVVMYKGSPCLSLNPDDAYPFTFGVKKAKMILKNIEAIQKFVDDNDE